METRYIVFLTVIAIFLIILLGKYAIHELFNDVNTCKKNEKYHDKT